MKEIDPLVFLAVFQEMLGPWLWVLLGLAALTTVAFIWLLLPLGWRASTFARVAEAEGVLLRSADEYILQDGAAPNAVRIALAGGVPEERFLRATGRLARILENPPGDLPI